MLILFALLSSVHAGCFETEYLDPVRATFARALKHLPARERERATEARARWAEAEALSIEARRRRPKTDEVLEHRRSLDELRGASADLRRALNAIADAKFELSRTLALYVAQHEGHLADLAAERGDVTVRLNEPEWGHRDLEITKTIAPGHVARQRFWSPSADVVIDAAGVQFSPSEYARVHGPITCRAPQRVFVWSGPAPRFTLLQ